MLRRPSNDQSSVLPDVIWRMRLEMLLGFGHVKGKACRKNQTHQGKPTVLTQRSNEVASTTLPRLASCACLSYRVDLNTDEVDMYA
jgi:hypothetical protein